MAVEYQSKRYIFTKPAKVDLFGDSYQTEQGMEADDIQTRFLFNYYHDLESVLWVLVHYILTHVPAATAPDQESLSHLRSMQNKWSELFNVTIEGNNPRTQHMVHNLLAYIGRGLPTHATIADLLIPLRFNGALCEAYTQLEQQPPLEEHNWRWPAECFEPNVYADFVRLFNMSLERYDAAKPGIVPMAISISRLKAEIAKRVSEGGDNGSASKKLKLAWDNA
jgi:hypothetical protein